MPRLECNGQAVVAYVVRPSNRGVRMLSIPRRNTGEHAAPGGKVEPGETPEQALSREVKEETGCRVIRAWRIHEGCVNGYSVIVYRAEIEGKPFAKEPDTKVRWVKPKAIAEGFASELHSVAVRKAGLL